MDGLPAILGVRSIISVWSGYESACAYDASISMMPAERSDTAPPEPRVRFLDLRIADADERARLHDAIDTVLRHGRFIKGPEIEVLEDKVARYCGRGRAVAFGSGTGALFASMRALDIGPGDEVIGPALSWVATGTSIAMTGARPIFADVLEDLTIDPESVASLVSSRTKAVLPVHYGGKICDMAALRAVAERHGIAVIEDASQAFGARRGGKPAGAFGDFGAFSLNPLKTYAACGQAGIVVTDDAELAEKLRALQYNGMVDPETSRHLSGNALMDTLQAAILLARLDGVAAIIERRAQIAHRYTKALAHVLHVPNEPADTGDRDAWYSYSVRTPHRDALCDYLLANGIEAKIRDRILLPEQPSLQSGAAGRYPNAERYASELICLPLHEKMSDADADYVIDAVASFFESDHR